MIKRYIKELANDIRRGTHGYYDDSIEIILHALQRGQITNLEAARELCRLTEG